MKKLLTLTLFLAVFALSACGTAEQGSEQPDEAAAPSEQTQAEAPAENDAAQPEEAPEDEAAPEDSAAEEDGSEESASGPTATTIQGEEVSLGGNGEATALFFMAGW